MNRHTQNPANGGAEGLFFSECGKKQTKWWRELDSNQRTLARAELQSAAINHSTIPPHNKELAKIEKIWLKDFWNKQEIALYCQGL